MDNVKILVKELMTDADVKCKNRYEHYEELMKISEKSPKKLYAYWDELVYKLKSNKHHHKFHGVDLLANLAKVDTENKFEKIIDYYISLIENNSFVLAMHVVQNLGKIAKYKINLQNKITKALLNTKNTKHKHKALLMSGGIISFMQYYKYIKNKKPVIEFVKSLVNSDSPKARKKAKEFIKKYKI